MKAAALLTFCVLSLSLAMPSSYAAGAGRAAPAARGAAARGTAAGVRGAIAAGRNATARGTKPSANLTPDQRIDKREANQEHRINAGVSKGQLTSDEVERLQTMETNIDTMESNFKSDGKLSPDEVKQLRKSLNDASLQIWSERHDTEGNQKPVIRLGKDVFAQDQLTAKLESPDLTKAQAKVFLEDFRKMINVKRRLASDTLSADERAKLQAQYNDLLNQYFVIK